MGCSTSTLDDDPHPTAQNTDQETGDDSEAGKDKDIITYENNESQGNKFISNDQL